MCQKYGRYMVIFAVGAVLTAAGTTYTWTNARGDGDWTKSGNFTVGTVYTLVGNEEPATDSPGSDDQVYVPTDTTVVLEYDTSDPVKKASCEAFAALTSIRPCAGAVIDITVPADTTFPLSCSLARGTSDINYNLGHLIKRGAGELDLNAAGSIHANTSSHQEYYDYYCEMTVDEGVVRVVPSAVTAYIHLGKVTINENGTLFTANTVGDISDSYTIFKYLYGCGTITNDTGIANTQRMRVEKYADFSGRITGRIYYYSAGLARFTGTESTFPTLVVYQNYGHEFQEGFGSIEVAKFGMKAVDGVYTPSSIGYSGTVLVRDNAAAIRYIGNGETTDKDLRFWPQTTTYPLYLDGGPHGGLNWTGLWGPRDKASYQHSMLRLILQGSNTQDCVMSGVIESPTYNSTNYTFCITKQGTGSWYIKHNDSSRMLGVWRIVNGTLKYDTIAETGVNSALGSSTMLYKNLSGVLALDENKVDYAVWLGDGTSEGRANLEYVGATNCVSTTRRFAVTGTGAILNNGGGFLRLSDFFATNTPTTLVLGGTNTLDNTADGIADGGNAKMSVVKEGSGTWRLGTNCTFTGAIDVKEGRLEIGNPEKYTYYCWSIKENFYTNLASRTGASQQTVRLYSFGLFDDAGTDWVQNLSNDGYYTVNSDNRYKTTACVKNARYATFAAAANSGVRPGSFRMGTSTAQIYNGSQGFTNLFMHVDYITDWNRTTQQLIRETNSVSWIVFIMRPHENANPITSWDYVNAWNSSYPNQLIRLSTLEASVDGETWDEIARVERIDKPAASGRWQSNDASYVKGYTTHTTGMQIPPGPTNAVVFAASSVSVAAGAELIARAPEKPVIHALTVDGLAGGGTIDGFVFASDLTLTIDNVASAAGLTIPMTFRNVEGLDASGWTVSVGDKVKASLHVSASSSGLTITPTGMQFLIR